MPSANVFDVFNYEVGTITREEKLKKGKRKEDKGRFINLFQR